MTTTEPRRRCQADGCRNTAKWMVRNYFVAGSPAAQMLETRDLLRCAAHGDEHREWNPFLGWEEIK